MVLTITSIKTAADFSDGADLDAELYVEGNVAYAGQPPAWVEAGVTDDYHYPEDKAVHVKLYEKEHCAPMAPMDVTLTVRERDTYLDTTVGSGTVLLIRPGQAELKAGAATLKIDAAVHPAGDCPGPTDVLSGNVVGGGAYTATGVVNPPVMQAPAATLTMDSAPTPRYYRISGMAVIAAFAGEHGYQGPALVNGVARSTGEWADEGGGTIELLVYAFGEFTAVLNGYWHRLGHKYTAVLQGYAHLDRGPTVLANAQISGEAIPNGDGVMTPITSYDYAGVVDFLPPDVSAKS